jgi:16S rRNA (cytosine967-C5)-methyltransferase
VNGQNPRQIAARILQRVAATPSSPLTGLIKTPLQRGIAAAQFTEDLLEQELARAKLSALDRALCQELAYGVVRWRAALDWLIARKTNGREQKTQLQNLLRLGLYQIFWLDRIPPHAAVHETVELAKRGGFGPQAGFVNAVLRGCLREHEKTRKLLAELKISNPAVGWSHPEWLVEKWRARLGDEKLRQLLQWNNTPPKTFARVNTLKFCSSRREEALISKTETGNRKSKIGQRLLTSAATSEVRGAGDLLARWREENVEYDFVRRDWLEENLVFELKSHPPLASLASFRDGWFYVQDPSTLLAVTELNPQRGEAILDLCAAPGGKATFMAQRMKDKGKILACDISEKRLKLLRENCRRLGVTCVEFCSSRGNEAQISASALRTSRSEFSQSLLASAATDKKFDRILVDAPCSNTGVLRRRVDLRWRIAPEEISRLRRTQLDLLALAAPKLKPGGVLIYSTCSLEPEENAEVVREFLRDRRRFQWESERELLPFADDADGAYVAKLKLIQPQRKHR